LLIWRECSDERDAARDFFATWDTRVFIDPIVPRADEIEMPRQDFGGASLEGGFERQRSAVIGSGNGPARKDSKRSNGRCLRWSRGVQRGLQ